MTKVFHLLYLKVNDIDSFFGLVRTFLIIFSPFRPFKKDKHKIFQLDIR